MFVVVVVLLVGALLFVRRESAAVGPVAKPPAAAPTELANNAGASTQTAQGATATVQGAGATAQGAIGSAQGATATAEAEARAAQGAAAQGASTAEQVATSTPAAQAGATQMPTARAATATVEVTTATPVPVVASRAQSLGTPILEIKYFVVNGTQVAIGPGTPTPTIPWWQVRQDATDAHVKAIIDGYLHFWDVRAQALYALQPELARQVMTGTPLDNELKAIDEFRAKNQAQRVEVDHSITVLWATSDEGAVVDTLGDRSTMVDLTATPEPAPPQPTSPYRMAYRLKRAPNGVWQVVDSVRMVR
jgi:hypothetical protein